MSIFAQMLYFKRNGFYVCHNNLVQKSYAFSNR